MQTNNVITKMFDGISQKNISGVENEKKSETKSKDIFSNLLKQGTNFGDETRQSFGKIETAPAYEDSANSYDRYQYKKNEIESGKPMEEKITESAEQIETFAKDVIKAVAEQLEITEDDVVEAIQMLGVTVFDLLNPQVLAELTVSLTDAQDASMLLFDSRFQLLLSDIAQVGKDFMNDLGLNTEQMQMLLAQMELLEQPQIVDVTGDTNLAPPMILDGQTESEQQAIITYDTKIVENSELYAPKEVEEERQIEVVDEHADSTGGALSKSVENEHTSTTPGDSQEDAANKETGSEENYSVQNHSEKNHSVEEFKKSISNADKENDKHVFSHLEHVSDKPSEMIKAPYVQNNNTYVSVDTVRIIEQLAERVRVTNFSEVSSIEMQLNPENLGKMYVNISSKQGMVNAQIAATNETVKEALEAQIHELRETLQQSGIKVDAIEVTVASHEFEKNLEQGQSREEQEAERQEEMKEKNRRGLRLSDLEKLEDSLDEKETLIARMMKENGNSLDYTV